MSPERKFIDFICSKCGKEHSALDSLTYKDQPGLDRDELGYIVSGQVQCQCGHTFYVEQRTEWLVKELEPFRYCPHACGYPDLKKEE